MNSRKVSSYKSVGMILCILLSALILQNGCRGKKQDTPQRQAVWVTVSEAAVRDVPVYIDEIGSCSAQEIVSIRAQVSGQITEINFADGADLKKGDLLFTIDPRPYEAALKQAQANLEKSTALLALAKSTFERSKKLLPSGAISKDSYDTKENAVVFTQAQVQADQAAVQAAQVNLDYCFIHSPIDGRAGHRRVDVGNVVTANDNSNDAVLLVIHRMDPIYADFTINEQELESVRQEMAKGELKVYVRPPDKPDANGREGTLTFLDNSVQQETGTIKLRATVQNSDRYFWPGQFVQVKLVLSVEKDAVLVPSEAIQNSQNGQFVYVVKSDQTVEFRPVTVKRTLDGQTVVEGQRSGCYRRPASIGRRRKSSGQNIGQEVRQSSMNFTSLFINRPTMTTLVMSGILIFGIASYRLLPVSDLPNVDFPTIQVSASLPGASPETMAAAVATPLEKQFSTIAGIDSMTSASALGSTQIIIQFNLNRDIDAAAQDVQAAIAQAQRRLPDDMPSPPSYQKVNPADQPILFIALTSPMLPLSALDEYGQTLMPRCRFTAHKSMP
jgi:multidrug efflux system membrane fusion protein